MELFVDSGINDRVYHLEEDRRRPGYVIFNDGGALKSTNGQTMLTIAGTTSAPGYENGQASSAKFEDFISSFLYVNNSHLIVSDSKNYCLRLFNLIDEIVSDFAGRCKTRGFASGPLLNAEFKYPTYMTWGQGKYEYFLYILDQEARSIRYIDLTRDFVFKLVDTTEELRDVTGIVFDTVSDNKLVVKSSYYIRKVYVDSYGKPMETIYTASWQVRQDHRDRDGILAESYCAGYGDWIAIGKNVYLQTGERTSGRLRVMDLKKGGVSTICLEHGRTNAIDFKGGSIDKCQLPLAHSVALIANDIYVGGSGAIYKLKSNYIRHSLLLYSEIISMSLLKIIS